MNEPRSIPERAAAVMAEQATMISLPAWVRNGKLTDIDTHVGKPDFRPTSGNDESLPSKE